MASSTKVAAMRSGNSIAEKKHTVQRVRGDGLGSGKPPEFMAEASLRRPVPFGGMFAVYVQVSLSALYIPGHSQ